MENYLMQKKTVEQQGTWINGEIHNGFGKKTLIKGEYFIGDIYNGSITQNGKIFNHKGDQLNVL